MRDLQTIITDNANPQAYRARMRSDAVLSAVGAKPGACFCVFCENSRHMSAAQTRAQHASRVMLRQAENRPWRRKYVTDKVTLPAAWASAIVNGDFSGMEPGEVETMDAALAFWTPPGASLTVDSDAEPYFSWHYGLYGGTSSGGDVLDYTMVYPVMQ